MAATDRVVCLNRHVCCSGQPEAVSRHPEYLALFGPRAAASLAVYATSTTMPTISPARWCRRTRRPQKLPKGRRMTRVPAMLDDFLVRAMLGGIGVAALAGPLGCFVVWRRMAFFGNALAHSALLGIALGALLAVDLNLATVAVCLVFAIALVLLQRQPALSTDTMLGILAHVALALGLVALSFLEWLRVDLMAYLFGDVLAVTAGDLIWIWGGGAVALAALLWLWSALLSITLNEELAQAEGVDVGRVQFGFMLVMALAVAIGMKIVGILLIVSLLVIPAAAARQLARTPEQMAALAALIGALAVVAGVGGSLRGTRRPAPRSWSRRPCCSRWRWRSAPPCVQPARSSFSRRGR